MLIQLKSHCHGIPSAVLVDQVNTGWVPRGHSAPFLVWTCNPPCKWLVWGWVRPKPFWANETGGEIYWEFLGKNIFSVWREKKKSQEVSFSVLAENKKAYPWLLMTSIPQDGGRQFWNEANTVDLRACTGPLPRPLNLLSTQPESLPASGPFLCQLMLRKPFWIEFSAAQR